MTKKSKKGLEAIGVIAFIVVAGSLLHWFPSAMEPMEKQKKPMRKKILWPGLATGAYIAGAGSSLIWSTIMLEKGTNPSELESLFVSFVVWGLLIAGLGQVLMAASHGSDQTWKFWTDGIGKLGAVLGWSLGAVGGVMFAMKDTEAERSLIGVMVFLIFVVPILVWATVGGVAFWRRNH